MRTIYQVEVKMSQNISSGQPGLKLTAVGLQQLLTTKVDQWQFFSAKLPPYEESSQGARYTVSYDKTAVTNNGSLNNFVGKVAGIANNVKTASIAIFLNRHLCG